MDIDGISITNEDGCVVCYINDFSDELKAIIKEDLVCICYGKNEVDEDTLDHYSYADTLRNFLNRYEEKSDETKKGMIGEFIAHLIINKVLSNLQSISIFFNKEDLSIKKGFDLNYVDIEKSVVWYGEVKSGEVNVTSDPDTKNKELLGASKRGIAEYLTGARNNLWESVIIDAGLSFPVELGRNVKNLLKMDIKDLRENTQAKKNAILISVLYHNIENKIAHEGVREYFKQVTAKDIFSEVIIFSIQKSTYKKIEDFLNKEATAC